MLYIVHLLPRADWLTAQASGEYHPTSLEREGFIHCSRPEQVTRVARRFYREVPDLVLLWLDLGKIKPQVRWETADGERFPHIFGPLNLDAVVSVQDYDPEKAILVPPG